MNKIRPVEFFLAQVVIYLLLWLTNDYLASLLTVMMAALFGVAFLFVSLAEWIETSKVPRNYFRLLLAAFLAPVLTGIVFFAIYGLPDWLMK